MCGAGVRDTGYGVDVHLLVSGEGGAAAVACLLDVDALVAGGGVSVVDEEEGAESLFGESGEELFESVGFDEDGLAGFEPADDLVVEVLEGAGLEGGGEGVDGLLDGGLDLGAVDDFAAGSADGLGLLADDDGGSAEFVTDGDDAVAGEEEHGAGALDFVLGAADAVGEGLFEADEAGDHLGGVDAVAGHFGEVGMGAAVGVFAEGVEVVDESDDGDAEGAEVAEGHEGLVAGVADGADAGVSFEMVDVVLEFASELGVADVMDIALEALFSEDEESAALIAEV